MTRAVWVFTLGNGYYAVEDPSIIPAGEFMPVYILDCKFVVENILYAW